MTVVGPRGVGTDAVSQEVMMTRMRRASAALAAAAVFAATVVPAAVANPSPPTNGGNGAGKSGQCTGANADRPSSCKSQGGPGNQP